MDSNSWSIVLFVIAIDLYHANFYLRYLGIILSFELINIYAVHTAKISKNICYLCKKYALFIAMLVRFLIVYLLSVAMLASAAHTQNCY